MSLNALQLHRTMSSLLQYQKKNPYEATIFKKLNLFAYLHMLNRSPLNLRNMKSREKIVHGLTRNKHKCIIEMFRKGNRLVTFPELLFFSTSMLSIVC